MALYRCVLLEDDVIYEERIASMLEGSEYTIIQSFYDTEGVWDYLLTNKVDLFICDLFIDGKPHALPLIQQLVKSGIPIVCISSSTDSDIFNSLKNNIKHYLVKPFHKLTLLSTLAAVSKNLEINKQQLSVSKDTIFVSGVGGKKQLINLSDILYLSVEGNYTYIHTLLRKYVLKLSLNKTLSNLLDERFVRIHHQYAVNSFFIKFTEYTTVWLHNGVSLPIGNTFRSKARKDFQQKKIV